MSLAFLNISNNYASYKNVNQGLFIEKYLLAYTQMLFMFEGNQKSFEVVNNDRICPVLTSFSGGNKSSREVNK